MGKGKYPFLGGVHYEKVFAFHSPILNKSEFTQQDGRKKTTVNRMRVTNKTRLFRACFVVIFTNINVFWSVNVGENLFQTNLLSRLSHKVCRLLSSPVLLRKFTDDIARTIILGTLVFQQTMQHLIGLG